MTDVAFNVFSVYLIRSKHDLYAWDNRHDPLFSQNNVLCSECFAVNYSFDNSFRFMLMVMNIQ